MHCPVIELGSGGEGPATDQWHGHTAQNKCLCLKTGEGRWTVINGTKRYWQEFAALPQDRAAKEAMTLARAWDGPDISCVECRAGMLSEMLSGRSCVTQIGMRAELRKQQQLGTANSEHWHSVWLLAASDNVARQTANTCIVSGYLQQVITWHDKQRTLAQCLATCSKR